MPKLSARIKSNGLPDVCVSAKVETVKDLPRFFATAAKEVKALLRFFPEAGTHKVSSVTVRPE
jgi:hypothetical protein